VRIEPLIDNWAEKLLSAQRELVSELSLKLGAKPLRPLWVSDRSVIWSQSEPSFLDAERERQELTSLAFIPIYLLSVSKAEEHPTALSCDAFQRHSWRYIHGAADDHESWARGLTPHLFWEKHDQLLNAGPDLIAEEVAALVRDRRAREEALGLAGERRQLDQRVSTAAGRRELSWIGDFGLAVGSVDVLLRDSDLARSLTVGGVTAVLNCSGVCVRKKFFEESGLEGTVALKQLRVESHKYDRLSLQRVLGEACDFALKGVSGLNLTATEEEGEGSGEGKVAIVCDDGQDTAPSVAAAVCLLLKRQRRRRRRPSGNGSSSSSENDSDSDSEQEQRFTKEDVKNAVSWVAGFCPAAHPSRGNLKQVYNFLRTV